MINALKYMLNKIKSSRKLQVCLGIYLVFYVALFVICCIPTKQELVTPGVLSDPSEFITVDTNYDKGAVNTVAVFVSYKPSVFQTLITKPNNKIEISDYDPSTSMSPNDLTLRSIYLKDLSIDYALINAYTKAKEKDSKITIDYSFKGLLVTANIPGSYSKEVKIGDLITGIYVNDVLYPLNERTYDGYDAYLASRGVEDTPINYFVYVTSHAQKTYDSFELAIDDKKVSFKYNDNKLYLELFDKYEISSSSPKYTINKDTVYNTIGSSGGMMLTLIIYNSLLANDYTYGLKICGTGTVSITGECGEIGGVAQKIHTSQLYKADVFFCPYKAGDELDPESNYYQAKEAYDSIKSPTFSLVKVSNFDDVLSYLESRGN